MQEKKLSRIAEGILTAIKNDIKEGEDIDIRAAANSLANAIAEEVKKDWLVELEPHLSQLEDEQEEKAIQDRREYLADLLHDQQKEEASGL